jgi:hypothetical protein
MDFGALTVYVRGAARQLLTAEEIAVAAGSHEAIQGEICAALDRKSTC